jgi:hypothetical protein
MIQLIRNAVGHNFHPQSPNDSMPNAAAYGLRKSYHSGHGDVSFNQSGQGDVSGDNKILLYRFV